jgi:dTDP-4-dehydrorhamnose 3,5-epimerase
MPFTFRPLDLPGLVLIEPRTFGDQRGYFRETFKASEFAGAGLPVAYAQDNLSHSTRGVLRGLHFQKPPQAQGKLVCAPRGEIFDVAVDLRRGSPTWGRWAAATLSDANGCLLYVPPGFAHGFCVLSAEADVLYKVTAEWAPGLESGIVWNDPDLGVAWPLGQPVLSERDAALPRLRDADPGFVYGGPA